MILLRAGSLEQVGELEAETLKVDMSERNSTASATMAMGTELTRNDWIMDTDWPGRSTVWRVRSRDNSYETSTATVNLEHVINSLRDVSIFGNVTPATILDQKGAKQCTARQAAEFILRHQSDWVLGDFDYDLSAPFSFNGETLYDAMEIISGALDGAEWQYDFSSYPFTLHIRDGRLGEVCEMRESRNMSTLRVSEDWSKTYTRIYPIGKNNIKLPEEYLSHNEEIYGRRDKIETDQSQGTVEMLRLWAEERLRKHSEPTVSIQISGLELSRSTGEDLDALILGRICQVAMPKYGTVIREKIVKLSWRDRLKEPESVTVTLCNSEDDVAKIISKSNSGGGRKAREEAEDHAWFVDTADHVAMVAEAIVGREGDSVDWSRVAEIIVDGTGISQSVTKAEEDIIKERSRITQTENKIALIVDANGIRPAQIVAAINNGGSEIKLSADHITLDGETVAKSLDGKEIICGDLSADQIICTNMKAMGAVDLSNGAWMGENSLGDSFIAVEKRTSGDTVTLVFSLAGGGTEEITFNKAGSVTPALSGSWSGGVLTIDSTPEPLAKLYYYLGKDVSWSGNTAKVSITSARSGSDPGTEVYSFDVSAQARYDAGKNSVTLSDPEWGEIVTNNTNSVRIDASNGQSKTANIYLDRGSWSGKNVYVYVKKDNAQGENLARLQVSVPSSGWSYSRVSVAEGYYRYDIKLNGTTVYAFSMNH